MGWVLEFIGVALGSAVIPITLAVNSAHVSPIFMTYAPSVGTISGFAVWLGVTKGMFGEININTTSENWSMFAGCLASLVVQLLIWIAIRTFVVRYDWDLLFLMVPLQPREGDNVFTHGDEESLGLDWDPVELARASKMAKIMSAVLCVVFLIIIPFPLYDTGYIMSRNFFTGWTVVVFVWSWCATLLIWCMPPWQLRRPLMALVKGIFDDVTGRRKANAAETLSEVEIEPEAVEEGEKLGQGMKKG